MYYRANECTCHLPVAIMTCSDEETSIPQSCQHGANGYSRKLVDFVNFTKAVKQYKVSWLELNSPPSPGKKLQR